MVRSNTRRMITMHNRANQNMMVALGALFMALWYLQGHFVALNVLFFIFSLFLLPAVAIDLFNNLTKGHRLRAQWYLGTFILIIYFSTLQIYSTETIRMFATVEVIGVAIWFAMRQLNKK